MIKCMNLQFIDTLIRSAKIIFTLYHHYRFKKFEFKMIHFFALFINSLCMFELINEKGNLIQFSSNEKKFLINSKSDDTIIDTLDYDDSEKVLQLSTVVNVR